MNEKMTDEDVALYQQIAAGDVAVNEDLLREWTVKAAAHIAALTTERDEALKDAEVSDATARSNVAELDALRERVQALEVEVEDRKVIGAALNRSNSEMGEHLAALRQRAGNIETLSGAVKVRLERGETPEMIVVAIARYIIGEDARPLAPPEAFTHEKGLDAGVFDEPTAEPETKAERLMREEREASADMVRRAAEPTTAEAFAMVRAGAEKWIPEKHPDRTMVLGDVSLLERRMRAMEVAARTLIAGAKEGIIVVADINALESALTDAPPVFSLEEVESAVSLALSDAELETGESPDLVPLVRQRLTALRK